MKFRTALMAAAMTALLGSSALAEPVHFLNWSSSEAGSKPFMEREIADVPVDVENISFPFGKMLENIVLRFRTGQPSEVIQNSERWVPLLAQAGAIRKISEIYDRSELEKFIDPGILDAVMAGGDELYGVPWTFGSIAMVVNMKVLEKAGVSKIPETMDEFRDALVKIKKAIPDSTPFGMATKNVSFIQLDSESIFWQFGARFFDGNKVVIDSPEARKALTFLVSLLKDGLMSRDIDRATARTLFSQELTAFYFDPPVARSFARTGSGKGSAYDANVLAIPTPLTGNGEPPRSVLWTHLLSVGTGEGVDVAGAKKVIEHFALDPQTQIRYWNEVGLFPTTKDAIAKVGSDRYLAGWLDIAKTSLLDEPARFGNSEELRAIIGEEIEAAYQGAKSPDEAITAMATRLRGALK